MTRSFDRRRGGDDCLQFGNLRALPRCGSQREERNQKEKKKYNKNHNIAKKTCMLCAVLPGVPQVCALFFVYPNGRAIPPRQQDLWSVANMVQIMHVEGSGQHPAVQRVGIALGRCLVFVWPSRRR